MISFKTILVPIDFEAQSKHAIDVAIDLAIQSGGTVRLLHVWDLPVYPYTTLEAPMPDLSIPTEKAAARELAAVVDEAKKKLASVTGTLVRGEPWREIIAAVNASKPDLVVMGTHGRTGIEHYVLGSVAEKVVRSSRSPVLTLGLHP